MAFLVYTLYWHKAYRLFKFLKIDLIERHNLQIFFANVFVLFGSIILILCVPSNSHWRTVACGNHSQGSFADKVSLLKSVDLPDEVLDWLTFSDMVVLMWSIASLHTSHASFRVCLVPQWWSSLLWISLIVLFWDILSLVFFDIHTLWSVKGWFAGALDVTIYIFHIFFHVFHLFFVFALLLNFRLKRYRGTQVLFGWFSSVFWLELFQI